MEKLRGMFLVTAAVFCSIVALTSATAVVDTNCTSSGNECPTNSVCNTLGTAPFKCKCNAAYKQGTNPADNTCVPKVLEDSCTAGANAECANVTNAECRAADNKCGCPVQYKTVSGACIARVLEDQCKAGANVECAGVPNAECRAADNKCGCPVQYKTVSGACTVRGLTEKCTADADCTGVSNAECVGETGKKACTCKSNYKTDSGKCNTANGLQTLLSAPVALLLSFLTIVITRLH